VWYPIKADQSPQLASYIMFLLHALFTCTPCILIGQIFKFSLLIGQTLIPTHRLHDLKDGNNVIITMISCYFARLVKFSIFCCPSALIMDALPLSPPSTPTSNRDSEVSKRYFKNKIYDICSYYNGSELCSLCVVR
jgi:hypothetical protein